MRTDAARFGPLARRIALYAALVVLAVPFVVPTLWMVASSFKPLSEIFASPPSFFTDSPTAAAYSEAFAFQPFARQYFNSVYIALTVTVLVLLVSALAGYAFARIRFPAGTCCSWWCSSGCSCRAR
nr:hypothetical protein GCM10025732_36340 [Glycomyces mayteni]